MGAWSPRRAAGGPEDTAPVVRFSIAWALGRVRPSPGSGVCGQDRGREAAGLAERGASFAAPRPALAPERWELFPALAAAPRAVTQICQRGGSARQGEILAPGRGRARGRARPGPPRGGSGGPGAWAPPSPPARPGLAGSSGSMRPPSPPLPQRPNKT